LHNFEVKKKSTKVKIKIKSKVIIKKM